MKIEKLPAGSYRVRKMYKGKTYIVVFDKKPTQKEAVQAMALELDKVQEKPKSGLLRKFPRPLKTQGILSYPWNWLTK